MQITDIVKGENTILREVNHNVSLKLILECPKNHSDNGEIPENNFFRSFFPFLNSPTYFEPLG